MQVTVSEKIYFHATQHNKRIVAYFTVAKTDTVQTGISGAVSTFLDTRTISIKCFS